MTATAGEEPRPDWRESFTVAADLALLGLIAVVACLPVVTIGAVLASASAGVDRLCRTRTLPAPGDYLRTAARAALGGLAATAVAVVAAAVLILDLRLLVAGVIPGGGVALVGIGGVAVAGLAVAATTVVRVGQTGGTGWVAALRWSLALLRHRPLAGPAIVATVALPVLLGLAIPVTTVLLPGFVLYGLHIVVRRSAAESPRPADPPGPWRGTPPPA